MRYSLFILVSCFILLLFSIHSVKAQGEPTNSSSNTIAGGVVNGKAISLPKPAYPPAARAVKAGGAVSVQVTIDENGEVISAAAVSGHPLLRAVAEQAARQAKFNPTLLSGESVKVTGIIIYNFAPVETTRIYSTNWVDTGMLLSALEKSPTLRYFEPGALTQIIPPDWTSEKHQIERLIELKDAEAKLVNNDFPKERIIDERTTKNPNDSMPTTTRTMTTSISPERNVSSESIAIAQSLTASIQGHLGVNPLDLWYFNLGLSINQGLEKADSRNVNERLKSAQTFREAIKSPPAIVPTEISKELQKMALMIEQGIFTDDDKVALSQSLIKLHSFLRN